MEKRRVISARDVCRCPRSRHAGRRYFGWDACLGCGLLITDAATIRRLDRLQRRPVVSEEPEYWQKYIRQLQGAA